MKRSKLVSISLLLESLGAVNINFTRAANEFAAISISVNKKSFLASSAAEKNFLRLAPLKRFLLRNRLLTLFCTSSRLARSNHVLLSSLIGWQLKQHEKRNSIYTKAIHFWFYFTLFKFSSLLFSRSPFKVLTSERFYWMLESLCQWSSDEILRDV